MTPTVQQFAEQLLYGKQLSDKLSRPKGLKVSAGEGSRPSTPKAPGRPQELRFLAKSDREAFPSVQHLDDPKIRGKILHFFANHELLAIELMALALIKFPDTPVAFQKEVIALLAQEQTHLQLYIDRMNELGVNFGDVPVNDFFWRTISPVDSPLKYVAHLNLGFEQANLDFALHYERLFEGCGDFKTAALMRRVYLEEIGHVAHGVRWFETWRDDSRSEWDDFCGILQLPFSPARARGIGFDFEGRRKAGLSEEFIAKLHRYKKHAQVFWFNPNCELEILNKHAYYQPPQHRQIFAKDFAWCMSYLADAGDVVLMQESPSTNYLQKLIDAGFCLPHVKSNSSEIASFKPRPWGWSPVSKRMLHARDHHDVFINKVDSVEWFLSFYEENIASMPELGPAELLPRFIRSYADAKKELDQINGPAVIKLPNNAGGQGNLLLPTAQIGEREKLWIEKAFRQNPVLVLEPWLERVCDWGQQLHIFANGSSYKGLSRYETYATGQLRRYLMGDPQMLLTQEIRRAINGRQTYFDLLKKSREFVTSALINKGYLGPAGIDTFIFKYQGHFYLRPIVEINSRYTFGHVALALEDHIAKGSLATWQFMNRKQLPKNCQNFEDFAHISEKQFPVVMQDHKIQSGMIFTNDPSQAHQYVGVMQVFLNKDIESIHPEFTLA